MFSIQIKTNIRAKCEILLHIINKLIPHGERQVASGVGRNCCFWRAACFRSEVRSWNGRRVQYFLIKAQQYPMILSRGKHDCWLTPSFLSERESTQCSPKTLLHSSLRCRLVAPPQITSAPLGLSSKPMEILCVLCAIHKH